MMSDELKKIRQFSEREASRLEEPQKLRELRADCLRRLEEEFAAAPGSFKENTVKKIVENLSASGKDTASTGEGSSPVVAGEQLPEAVEIVPFSDLDGALLELVEDYYWAGVRAAGENIYDYLRGALRTGGELVYVSPGVELEDPLEITTSSSESFQSNHLLIVAGEGSEFEFVRTRKSDAEAKVAAENVEIIALENSCLQYADFQAYGNETADSGCLRVRGHEDSRVDLLLGKLGRGDTHYYTCGSLVGQNSEIYSNEAVLATGDQRVISRVTANHRAPETTEEMITRGVVNNGASGEFNGKIKVEAGAHTARGSLHERALMVGDESRAVSVPGLEIDENDVEVAHSASVGEIDSRGMFYMKSRGLEEAQARRLVIHGFFEVLLEDIENKQIKERLKKMIDQSLGELDD